MQTVDWMQRRMASLSQMGGAASCQRAGKTGGGFQELMARTRAEQTEAARSAGQNAESEKTPPSKKAVVSPEAAAMLAAGYAQPAWVDENGRLVVMYAMNENGRPVLPLAALEKGSDFDVNRYLTDGFGGKWAFEVSDELISALEKLLAETGDTRSVESILRRLEERLERFEPNLELAGSKNF